MKIKVIDCGSSKVSMIVKMLEELGMNVETQKLDAYQFTNENAIVMSGAPILLTEINYQPYLDFFQPIINSNTPLFGICFGHQLIGLHHGAKISRCEEDRNDQKISFHSSTKLGDDLKGELIFNEDHCECISLPNEFNLIASSSICEVEMMEHPTKKIYGVQFHPETSGENGKKIFQLFINNCIL